MVHRNLPALPAVSVPRPSWCLFLGPRPDSGKCCPREEGSHTPHAGVGTTAGPGGSQPRWHPFLPSDRVTEVLEEVAAGSPQIVGNALGLKDDMCWEQGRGQLNSQTLG